MFCELCMKMRRRVLLGKELNFHALDYGNVGMLRHKSSTSLAGSSKLSFTRTRKVTASRPSTIRWS